MLAKLRTVATPAAREKLYVIAVAFVTMLAALGFLAGGLVAPIIAVVAATLALGFAAVQKSPTWRVALYGVLAPVQGLLQLYGVLDDAQWASISGLVAAVLGLAVAGAKAPTTNAAPAVE